MKTIKVRDSEHMAAVLAVLAGAWTGDANHRRAAAALADKLGWDWGDQWVGGGSADGRGFVFVDSSP